jgi:hypothetical protein
VGTALMGGAFVALAFAPSAGIVTLAYFVFASAWPAVASSLTMVWPEAIHVRRLPDCEVVARARVLDQELRDALLLGEAPQLAVEALRPGVRVDRRRGALQVDAGGHQTISVVTCPSRSHT